MYLQEAVGISAVFTQEVAYPMLRTIYANFEEYLCVTLCAGMILCLALQVSIRMIWGSALAWTEELSRYCFIWTVYIGMSLATKRLAQVRITAQFLKMPLKMRLFFRILSDMICVAFNVANHRDLFTEDKGRDAVFIGEERRGGGHGWIRLASC